jgi:hypothetical protein
MKKFPSLIALTLVLLVLAAPSVASAAEYGGIGGRPAYPRADNSRTKSIFIYQLKSGQTATDGVRVYNNTAKQQTISVYAVDSALSSGGGFACRQAADPREDVGSWLKLRTNTVTLPANGSQVVPFTVTVPAHADAGEHDGCIALQAQSASNNPSDRSGVMLSFRSAIRVAVTVPGKIVKKLTLEAVAVSKLKDGGYAVAPTVRNDGNVSLDTDVRVELASITGLQVGKHVGGTYPVLSRSQASWNFETKPPFWGGWYRAHVTATYNSNPTTMLGMDQGSPQQVRLASAVFFVPPSAAASLIYLAVLLVITAVVVLVVRKRRDIRHIRKHWEVCEIEEGATVTSLAKQCHTSWRKIVRVNKLKPPYALKAGQKLTLPPNKTLAPASTPKLARNLRK